MTTDEETTEAAAPAEGAKKRKRRKKKKKTTDVHQEASPLDQTEEQIGLESGSAAEVTPAAADLPISEPGDSAADHSIKPKKRKRRRSRSAADAHQDAITDQTEAVIIQEIGSATEEVPGAVELSDAEAHGLDSNTADQTLKPKKRKRRRSRSKLRHRSLLDARKPSTIRCVHR